jgi:small subunit ribosomal protein S6
MSLYEVIFILRQDLATSEVDSITEDFNKIIRDNTGEVIKSEYWGLRNLAYEIKKNKKGHYVLLGVRAPGTLVKELQRKMKINENVIRYAVLKVEEISSDSSPILKGQIDYMENSIDVTTSPNELI